MLITKLFDKLILKSWFKNHRVEFPFLIFIIRLIISSYKSPYNAINSIASANKGHAWRDSVFTKVGIIQIMQFLCSRYFAY